MRDTKAPVTKYGRDYWINARTGAELVKHFYELANAREISVTETSKPPSSIGRKTIKIPSGEY